MVKVMKIMETSFKMSGAHTVPLSVPDPAADHRGLTPSLDTHGQVWVSLFWSHCSFLLVPGAHKVLFVPSKSLFSQSCKFWLLYGGVNGNFLQEGLCHTQVCCTQSPCLCGRPLLTHTSAGDAQTLKGRSDSVSVESPGVHKVLFEPSQCLR